MEPRVADIPPGHVVARRIAQFLRFMRGRVVPAEMLVEYDRPNGPPKHPVQVINITIQRLRDRGHPVGGVRGRGFVWDKERTFSTRARGRSARRDRLDDSV